MVYILERIVNILEQMVNILELPVKQKERYGTKKAFGAKMSWANFPKTVIF